jgi:hypothetical protein
MLRGALCIVLSAGLFWLLATCLWSAVEVPGAQRDEVQYQFIFPEACQPEPGERLVFLAGVAFFPVALAVGGLACRWCAARCRFRVPAAVLWAAELALGGLLLLLCRSALLGEEGQFHLARNLFYGHPWATLPLLGASLVALWWGGRGRLLRAASHALVLALLALLALVCTYDQKGAYAGHVHFNAMFDPVVQVQQGKALLVDYTNQYGLYPHFLQPVFACVGLSVLTFTAVMGLLTAGSYAALWVFLAGATRSRAAALLGLLALVYHNWFEGWAHSGEDLYFQYHPVRLVFPAALVLLAWHYLHRPGRGLYWGVSTLLAAGVLWNLDSGLPALLSWAAFLTFGELCRRPCWSALFRGLLHLAAAAAALAGVTAAYAAYTFLGHGALPDFLGMLYYQRLYYLSGFSMVPMPLPGTWVLVVLVYLAGLASSFLALQSGRDTPRVRMTFLLSVLGTGLFSYYQGRSVSCVLSLASWPCFLLLALFLDELLGSLRGRPGRPLAWLTAGVIAWGLAGSAWSILPHLPPTAVRIRENLGACLSPGPSPVEQEADLLRRATPPAGQALVISSRDGLLHLLSGVRSVCPSAYSQLVLLADFEDLCRLLAHRPDVNVFVDRESCPCAFCMLSEPKFPGLTVRAGWVLLFRLLLERGYEVTATPTGYVFRKRPAGAASLVGAPEPQAWGLELKDGQIGSGLPWPTFSWTSFSLEMVVRPAARQVARATLVGNHPGLDGRSGFVIEHEGDQVYSLTVGDGKGWRPLLRFRLEPEHWNYLAVVAEPGTVRVYLDGRQAGAADRSAITVQDSELPCRVGNWAGNDRLFTGLVKEVKVLRRALTPSEVGQRWQSVRRELSRLP